MSELGFNQQAQGGDDVQLERLRKAVADMPGLQESLDERGLDITDITDVFGYGSLHDHPHYTVKLNVQQGIAQGWQRDFVVECSRSGTNEYPGLVFGLNENEKAEQAGGILSYEGLTLEERAENLERLCARETMKVKGEHVYKFSIVDVEAKDGSIRPCITCVADQEAPGYAGDLSFDEKAERIATAHNGIYVQGGSPDLSHPDSTVLSRTDIRASRGYFNQCALIPMLAMQRSMTPTGDEGTDFDRRYERAIINEASYLHDYEQAIEEHRRDLPRDEQRFLAQAELIHTNTFFNDSSSPDLMEALRAGLEEEIEELSHKTGPAPQTEMGDDHAGAAPA